MTTDTTVLNLIINTMTAAQYSQITPSATELYFVTDEAITSSDVTTALGYTPTSPANVDGQWVSSIVKIVDSVSNTSGTNIYLDSNGTSGAGQNYLPDDNYKYEVIFQIRMGCNTSQGTQVTLNCGTDIIDTNLSGEIFTVSKNATAITVVFTMPVGTSRYFKYSLSNSTSNTTACRVTAIGYRRIGTNS